MDYDPRQAGPDPYGSYDGYGAYGANGANDPYGLPNPSAEDQGNHARPTGTRRRTRGARNAWVARLQASNPLDGIVYRFQYRWETSVQYRRAASIMIAVSAIVTLCACVSLATILTTTALANAPTGGGPNANTNTGTSSFNGPHAFPTSTVPAWPTPVIPNANPIPNSKTPQPSPTVSVTPPSGPVDTCNGGQQGIEWDMSPCPQAAGQSGQLHIYARRYKSIGVNVIISFGCSGDGCTLDYTPDSIQLDATGNLTITYTVPAAAANSQVNITGFIQPQGGPQVPIVAAPVQ